METEILFWNLLKNAMEESQKVECPEVWVVLKTDEDSAILTVENSGRKLSAEDVAKSVRKPLRAKVRRIGLRSGCRQIHTGGDERRHPICSA